MKNFQQQIIIQSKNFKHLCGIYGILSFKMSLCFASHTFHVFKEKHKVNLPNKEKNYQGHSSHQLNQKYLRYFSIHNILDILKQQPYTCLSRTLKLNIIYISLWSQENTLIVPSFQLPLKLHIGMLSLTHEHNLLIENFTKKISNKSSISKGKLWDLILTVTTYHQHGKQI